MKNKFLSSLFGQRKSKKTINFSYVDGEHKPFTVEEMREYAHSNGWTLEEFYDAVDHGVPLGEKDAYIKKQRELKAALNQSAESMQSEDKNTD